MTAIQIGPAPCICRKSGDFTHDPKCWMPLHTRILVAREINRAWAEFVTDMHSGSTAGPDVAEKFWKYVTGTL